MDTEPQQHVRRVQPTDEGCITLYDTVIGDTFHSVHGPVAESQHIYLNCGMRYCMEELVQGPLNILEMGFGTALNALLSCQEALNSGRQVAYTSVELYPLQASEYSLLHFGGLNNNLLQHLHALPFGEWQQVNPFFKLLKVLHNFVTWQPQEARYNIVYYDAFSPTVQPELWSEQVFKKVYKAMQVNSVLVTYSSKGSVVRTLKSCGFEVEKLPGPKGKRHIVRALKR